LRVILDVEEANLDAPQHFQLLTRLVGWADVLQWCYVLLAPGLPDLLDRAVGFVVVY
jgi:hypothetical protein